MKGFISMISLKKLLAIAVALAVTLQVSAALAITSVKTVDLLHNNTNSPFFKTTPDGLDTFSPYTVGAATFTPVGDPRAGESTSITTNGVFSVVGNSTSAGGWTDGNGVPAGLTLNFNVSITFGVGAGSPAGSLLTLTNNGANRGDGLGITQTFHGNSTLASSNLNEVIGIGTDVFAASAVTVSDVAFTGTLTEPGFNFTPGTVGNFGPYVLRSSGFQEIGETAGLVSETGPADPSGQGLPTIGFGIPSSHPSEALRGQGVVASHVYIDNNFGTTPILEASDYNRNIVVDAADNVLWRKGDLAADGNGDTIIDQADYDIWRANFGDIGVRQTFPRQIGAWTLTPQNGTLGVKGIGYRYDVNFDITPALEVNGVPEPSAFTLLAMGLLAICSRRRGKRLPMQTI